MGPDRDRGMQGGSRYGRTEAYSGVGKVSSHGASVVVNVGIRK